MYVYYITYSFGGSKILTIGSNSNGFGGIEFFINRQICSCKDLFEIAGVIEKKNNLTDVVVMNWTCMGVKKEDVNQQQ